MPAIEKSEPPQEEQNLMGKPLRRDLIVRGPYKSVSELKDLLRERGLVIEDEDLANHYLSTVNHHRLSHYHRAFYKEGEEKRFRDGVTLDDVIRFYAFERRLRLMILGPLEKIEVSMRALLVKSIGDIVKNNLSEGEYANVDLFDRQYYRLQSKNHEEMFENIKRSSWFNSAKSWERTESARENNLRYYDFHFDYFNAWEILQHATFGSLSKLIAIAQPEVTTPIAIAFGFKNPVLRSTMRTLTLVRNACAHHESIWDTRFKKMLFPEAYLELVNLPKQRSKTTIYEICAILHIYLGHLSTTTTWYLRLKRLFQEYNPPHMSRMGFPDGWDTYEFWNLPDARILLVDRDRQ